MRDLLRELAAWHAAGRHAAMATLVGVRRSAPRRPGARMIVDENGTMRGSVSAGCVESDVAERARRVLDRGRPELARYTVADEDAFAVGLSCGGEIEVLVEPAVAGDPVLAALRAAVEAGQSAVLAMGLEPEALLGRKVLVRDGELAGSIDPAVDAFVAAGAEHWLAGGEACTVRAPVGGSGVRLYVEALLPPPRLVIVGATHTAVALCAGAALAGYRVSVVDPRAAYARPALFPEADEVRIGPPAQFLSGLALGPRDAVVALTHDERHDVPALATALRSGAGYVGALGSRRTAAHRSRRLREAGLAAHEVARLRSPVGLDIGARTPEEIAVAILAEMLAVRSGRRGGSLSASGARGAGAARE